MAASSKGRYPSDLINYPKVFLQLPTTRNPQRLHLIHTAKRIARVKKETFVAFVLRAVANEVRRFLAELANGPVEARISYDDMVELDVLALLSDGERKEYGL